MSVRTKEQLKQDFSDNQTATGAKFADLIDSLKAIQSAVSDPAASGTSITFIATISQDANGVIDVTKKTVNFSGYQTVAGMSAYQTVTGMATYQVNDLQQVGAMSIDESGVNIATTVNHEMRHYPTVRVIDGEGREIRPKNGLIEPYEVLHVDIHIVKIILDGSLNVPNARYFYILD